MICVSEGLRTFVGYASILLAIIPGIYAIYAGGKAFVYYLRLKVFRGSQ
jgi:hypothetical protein